MTNDTFIPAKRRRFRQRNAPTETPTPPVAFALIAATFDGGDPSVTLTFNEPIDIGGFDASQIVLWDGDSTQGFVGSGATMLSPASVKVTLEYQGYYYIEGIILNASDDTGIRAADEGPVWDGVVDLSLPFP